MIKILKKAIVRTVEIGITGFLKNRSLIIRLWERLASGGRRRGINNNGHISKHPHTAGYSQNDKIEQKQLADGFFSLSSQIVSHDLKTPLTAITTYVELLEDESISPQQRKGKLRLQIAVGNPA